MRGGEVAGILTFVGDISLFLCASEICFSEIELFIRPLFVKYVFVVPHLTIAKCHSTLPDETQSSPYLTLSLGARYASLLRSSLLTAFGGLPYSYLLFTMSFVEPSFMCPARSLLYQSCVGIMCILGIHRPNGIAADTLHFHLPWVRRCSHIGPNNRTAHQVPDHCCIPRTYSLRREAQTEMWSRHRNRTNKQAYE